jgi:Neuraminidase (sialidase)
MRDDSDADIESDANMRLRDDISAFLINSVDNRKSRTVLDSEVEVC